MKDWGCLELEHTPSPTPHMGPTFAQEIVGSNLRRNVRGCWDVSPPPRPAFTWEAQGLLRARSLAPQEF